MRFNYDITSLFSGLNTNNNSLFGSFNLSDYSLIKKGTYKKLMKSYYDEQSSVSKYMANNTSTINKGLSIDKTGLAQMKKESDGLKSAVDAFNKDDLWKQTDGNFDMDKIAGAVKNFANEYNDVIGQASKVSSKEVSQSIGYMSSMTNTMSKALAKVGVTVGIDGKLSVDEEVLKKSNATSVKSLFAGATSYGAQIESKASDIARATIMNTSMYSNNATLASNLNGMFDGKI